MYGIRHEKITEPCSYCYIATKQATSSSSYDDYGNEIPKYNKPEKYYLNIQPMSKSSEAQAYGQQIDSMKVTYVSKIEYDGLFKEYDLAYLDGATPTNEKFYGDNANYRIYSVSNQNSIIKIEFMKIVRGE